MASALQPNCLSQGTRGPTVSCRSRGDPACVPSGGAGWMFQGDQNFSVENEELARILQSTFKTVTLRLTANGYL